MAPTVQFIDFEYGAFGYRGFDWGNHFNEWAGFECEYSRYPQPPAAAAFLHAYLAEGATAPPVSLQRDQFPHDLLMKLLEQQIP